MHTGQEEVLGKGRYPHSKRGNIVSILIIVLFSLLLSALLPPPTLEITFSLALSILVVYLAVIHVRLFSFVRVSTEIVEHEVYTYPASSRRSRILTIIGALAFIFIPFFAAGLLYPVYWLMAMAGVIYGLNVAELIFTLYVRTWERGRGFILTRFEVWSEDASGWSRREKGVRAKAKKQPIIHR